MLRTVAQFDLGLLTSRSHLFSHSVPSNQVVPGMLPVAAALAELRKHIKRFVGYDYLNYYAFWVWLFRRLSTPVFDYEYK
jgi:hypothetical protein